jgi:2-polyprenyl-6-methoxyphenol hydroxylase-like FAD-dependent oxidoreductase
MTEAQTKPSPLLHNKRVVIAGAGPSGLTLARLLQMRGATVQVYDLDGSPNARNQGGALDMHEDSGQIAMREAGLMDQFLAASHPEGQESKVYDKHGAIHVDFGVSTEKMTRPEIDRGVLRKLFLDHLAPGTVHWGRQVKQVERTSDGSYRLAFGDGSVAVADLLFGCDGTWSKVRSLVSPIKPRYTGVTFIETRVSSVDSRYPDVSRLVGLGTILATGENKGLMAQRNGDGSIRVYVTLRVPEAWTQRCDLDFNQPTQARDGLLKLFDGWAPHVLEMLKSSDDVFFLRPLYTLPPEQNWQPDGAVTLLGDAAHVMPPFTGKGANYAMLDAVEVARNLTSGRFAEIPAALRAYETTMLARMETAITEVLADQDVLISPNAPEGIPEMFAARIKRWLEAKNSAASHQGT